MVISSEICSRVFSNANYLKRKVNTAVKYIFRPFCVRCGNNVVDLLIQNIRTEVRTDPFKYLLRVKGG